MSQATAKEPHLLGAPLEILKQALEGMAAALEENGRELYMATLQVEQRSGGGILVGRVVDSCGDIWAHMFGFEGKK